MSDLISRSKLIEALTKCKQLGRKSFEVVVNVINEQPTAYNVDTVVAELDKKAKRHGGEDYFVEFGDAIEIVKQGGTGKDVD